MRALVLLILAGVLAVGCTKKRDDRFSQGQGQNNLQTLSSFKDQSFKMTTKGVIAKAHVSQATNRTLEEKIEGINHFDIVEWESDSDLIGNDVVIRGKENHQYEIRHVVTDKYLKVFKVGSKDDIPHEEYPYAEKLENGELAVPLVGYDVMGYYRLEKQRNSDNEDTHIVIEVPELDPKKATHVRVNPLSRKVFDAVAKIDVYPADFFRGEWYISATPIEAAGRLPQQG